MSLKKTTVAGLMALSGVVASSAMAQGKPGETGWYLGGSVTQIEADGTCVPGASCDFKSTGFKIFGGYRINRHFAVEGFWGEWGEISASNAIASATVEQRTIGVAAVGILPIGQQFEVFGKLGLGNTEQNASGGGALAGFTSSDSGSDVLYGIGAAFNFTRNFGVRAEWERLNDSEQDILSIGIQYRF